MNNKIAFPTNRIGFDKQVEILRAFAIAAGPNGDKEVSNVEAADLVDLADSTVSLNNFFLTTVGLLTKTERGMFVPSDEVRDFKIAWEWDQDTAGHKLAPKLRASWFGDVLLTKLQMRSMSRKQAIQELAQIAGVDTTKGTQLNLLLDWLKIGGLIEIGDDGMVQVASRTDGTPSKPKSDAVPEKTEKEPRRTAVATTQSQGGISLNFALRVDMAELADWDASRITAFFEGVSQVLAAKTGIPQEELDDEVET